MPKRPRRARTVQSSAKGCGGQPSAMSCSRSSWSHSGLSAMLTESLRAVAVALGPPGSTHATNAAESSVLILTAARRPALAVSRPTGSTQCRAAHVELRFAAWRNPCVPFLLSRAARYRAPTTPVSTRSSPQCLYCGIPLQFRSTYEKPFTAGCASRSNSGSNHSGQLCSRLCAPM